MSFNLSFNGYYFLKETPEIKEWIKNNINIDEAQWILPPRQNQGAYTDLTFALSPPHKHKVKFNTLYYPPGVGQWAEFYGLMSGEQITTLLLQFTVNSVAPFIMHQEDSSIREVVTNMYLLPIVPLSETGVGAGATTTLGRIKEVPVSGKEALYVVRLVDERYFFQYKNTANNYFLSECNDWQSIINKLVASLGITVAYQSLISPNYYYASGLSDLVEISKGANPAILLEAVLYNIGMVIQRLLNGTYLILSFAEANSIGYSNAAITGYLNTAWLRAGGKWNLENRPIVQTSQKHWGLPEKIEVYYPVWDNGIHEWNLPVENHLRSPLNNIDYVAYNYTTAAIASELGIQYPTLGIQAQPGQLGTIKTFRDTARANLDHGVTTNVGELQNLTKQIAKDYVLRKWLSQRDEVWNEIILPEFNGLTTIEWEFNLDVHTRVTGEWLNYEVEELLHEICDGSSSEISSSLSSSSLISSIVSSVTSSSEISSVTSSSEISSESSSEISSSAGCVNELAFFGKTLPIITNPTYVIGKDKDGCLGWVAVKPCGGSSANA